MIERKRSSKFALINGAIVTPIDLIHGKMLVVNDGRIAGIDNVDSISDEIPKIDVGGRLISPGLIDIHTHGALGHTFNEPTMDAFRAITQENACRGVTSLLATTMTAAIPDLVMSLDFCDQWMQKEHANCAKILGTHVEGPYFSLAQSGAQDPEHIRTPNDGSVDHLLEYADTIQILTYAPELSGAVELTRKLVALDILPAAGHSSATEEDIQATMAAGLRHMIHIWSSQSTTVREGPWRKPGLLEVTLTYNDITAEMISDNRHLPPTLMKLAYKCIGPDRLCAISDATCGAGLPEGTQFQIGSLKCEVHDGVGMLLDRTAFAGSTTLLNEMIPILVNMVGIPLTEAIRMASLTPARVIGVDDRKGSLEVGKDADIAIFNEDFTAWRVLIEGEWAYIQD